MTDSSLYHRLGGYERIAAIVRELFAQMQSDPRFARFGTGRSMDSRRRTEQLTVDFVCAQMGGTRSYYSGRDMTTAHRGLGITLDEWNAGMEHTRTALQKNGVGAQEQQEFLALFEAHRTGIVDP